MDPPPVRCQDYSPHHISRIPLRNPPKKVEKIGFFLISPFTRELNHGDLRPHPVGGLALVKAKVLLVDAGDLQDGPAKNMNIKHSFPQKGEKYFKNLKM